MTMKLRALSAAFALSAVLAPSAVRADASCTQIMSNHFNWDANGPANLIRFQKIQVVLAEDNGSWSAYAGGRVFWNGGIPSDKLDSLSPLAQYFSDRTDGNGQPFVKTETDQISITSIGPDGTTVVHNNTWNFDATLNPTCVGNALVGQTTALTNHGNDVTHYMITVVDSSTPR
jgi:hypothetical protein